MLLQPAAKGISFNDVGEFTVGIRIRPQQHIHAGALCFRPGEEFGELGAWNHKPDAAAVELLVLLLLRPLLVWVMLGVISWWIWKAVSRSFRAVSGLLCPLTPL